MSGDKNAEARERLAQAVEELASGDHFAAWLRARSLFHSYSFGNVLLIASQRPDATQVAGYRTWQKLGRQVRKGERGIRILAPSVRKPKDDTETTSDTTDVVNERPAVYFRTVTVFDVAQTEGDKLPELEWASLEGDAPELRDHLSGIALAAGLTISREVTNDGARGYLDRTNGRIVVSRDVTSGAEAAHVVAHELGHYFDPWLQANRAAYGAHRGDCEAVAESVAYVVCASFGIDAGPSATSYVASWASGNAERVRELAARIDTAAREIPSTSREAVAA